MTEREKLRDLIDEAAELPHSEQEAIADHLLANGVTVQKWIPAAERLPENGQQVICYHGLAWNPKMTEEICRKGNGRPYGWSNVTHWMPLPTPPKEEP